MRLDDLLDRCKRLEERAAALYRSYAAAARTDPELCALWTALAREEEEHAHGIALAKLHRPATAGWRTRIEGWDDALNEMEERLTAAERIGSEATTDALFSAALELEMTELEALRQVVMAASGERSAGESPEHALRLAEAAERLSDHPQVRLQAALIRARTRLRKSA
jgi:hypothetical protein